MMLPQSAPEAPFIVLLVDDAEDCVAMLDVALQTLPGVVVCSAPSAEDALRALALGRIRAVVTDIQLPAMSGLELISRIRREPGLLALPIVAVSAATDPDTPHAALAAGANAFFPKPFSPAAVRRKLEELMYA